MDEISRFWKITDPTLHDGEFPLPVADYQLEAFEQKFGVPLPSQIIALYRHQNGGFSERHLGSFWSIESDEEESITTLQNLIAEVHEDATLEADWRQHLGGLDRVFAIFGDGHFYFVLNYNDLRENQPTVWYMDESTIRSTSLTFGEWLFRRDGGLG